MNSQPSGVRRQLIGWADEALDDLDAYPSHPNRDDWPEGIAGHIQAIRAHLHEIQRRRAERRTLGLTTVPVPPPPVPASGTQVIDTPGLPDGYTPPSGSLWPVTESIGILDGPLQPGATITLRTPEQARTAIRDAILRTRGGSPEFADALASVAVQALTGERP